MTLTAASTSTNLRKLAVKSQVVCVIKADGYGHGIRRVADALQEADVFAVKSTAAGECSRLSPSGRTLTEGISFKSAKGEGISPAEMRCLFCCFPYREGNAKERTTIKSLIAINNI